MIHRSSNDLHFRQVTTLLRRRWVLIVAFGLIGAAAAAGLGRYSVPLYTAKSQLLYDAEVRDEVRDAVVPADAAAAVETMVEMLLSPSHIRRLAESLAADPPVAAPEPDDRVPKDAGGGEAPLLAADLSYDGLELGLNAYKERQSRLVAVTFTTTDPKIAAAVANRATSLYLEGEANYRRDQRARTLQLTAARIPEARAELDRAERALRAHRVEFGLTDASVSDLTDRQIADLNRQLMVARSEIAAREAEIGRLGATGTRSDTRTATALGEDSGQMRLAVTPAAVERDAPAGFGDGNGLPGSPAASASALESARLDDEAIRSRIGDMERRLSTLRRASAETTQSWARLDELDRETNAAGQVYEGLLRRQDELLDQGLPRPSARLVTTAQIPDFPSSPSPLLFVAPAVVAALLLGGMIAVILERLDQRLRTEADVEDAVGVPCIGAVPRAARLNGTRLLGLLRDQPFAAYTEAMRGIFVASMRKSDHGLPSTTLLVTSCARGDGKTTLLASLAVYAAQLGHPVLVIDFDFRDPGLERVLGNADDPVAATGDLLSSLRPEARIRHSRAFGVDYVSLPDGRFDPLSVLESAAFPQAFARLKETYAYVMMDSGPILTATETRLLAKVADHVILAVRRGVTDVPAAQAAVQHLRAASADFSVVLNQARIARSRDQAAFRVPAGAAS